MAPSSQMAVASSTSGMALASSVLRTASALDFWTYAAWTPTSSPLPLLQFSKEGCFDPPGCLTWDFWHSLAHLLNPLVEAPKVALLKHCIGLTR